MSIQHPPNPTCMMASRSFSESSFCPPSTSARCSSWAGKWDKWESGPEQQSIAIACIQLGKQDETHTAKRVKNFLY